MKKVSRSSRIDKARPYLHMIAQLLYIIDQPEPKDYVLLAAVKYFRNITGYAKAETIMHLFSIPEKEFNKMIKRMCDKEWIFLEGEYINVSGSGDKKLDAAMGWVSYAIYNIKERIPAEKWSKLMK